MSVLHWTSTDSKTLPDRVSEVFKTLREILRNDPDVIMLIELLKKIKVYDKIDHKEKCPMVNEIMILVLYK